MTAETQLWKAEVVCKLAKADEAERVVTGVVLQPNAVDAHGDIVSAAVVKKAAYNFLAKYNQNATLGVQHKMFGQDLDLVESYVTQGDMKLGEDDIPEGTWVMSVRVNDDELWEAVQEGDLTGFSIGATATVPAEAENAQA